MRVLIGEDHHLCHRLDSLNILALGLTFASFLVALSSDSTNNCGEGTSFATKRQCQSGTTPNGEGIFNYLFIRILIVKSCIFDPNKVS
jgi:hypothetical protein